MTGLPVSGALRVIGNAMRHPLGGRRKLRTLAAIVRWQVASRLARRPLDFAWIAGTRLLVERGMTGATGNIYFGLHEVPDMAFMVHFLRPGETLFDIGANIGSYALLAANAAGARVVAFEPHPKTAAFLERNVAHNGLEGQIVVRRVGLSDRAGSGALTDTLDTMNHLTDGSQPGSTAVELETLDREAARHSPVMLKIDVEGHEEMVLAGGAAALADPGLLGVEIETVTPLIDRQLRAAGFTERFYDPFKRRLQETPVTGLLAANRLYLRNVADAQNRVTTAPVLRVGRILL